jgi:large subunit ribosomal protein L25
MKLKITKRSVERKTNNRALRRENLIPAVIYAKGHQSEMIAISDSELSAHMRHVVPGRLATTRFTLVGEDGKERSAIIKEIQYHPTTYDVMHVDFEELVAGQTIRVKIPIEFVGAAECAGVKQGGFLRQVIRGVRVCCTPENMPEALQLNVQPMTMKETRRLSDLQLPAGLRPLVDMHEVLVVVAKK